MKLLTALCLLLTAASSLAAGRRVEILYLGGAVGSHQPLERYKQCIAALGRGGINFTYTDKLTDLNLDNLRQYDGLLIYANHDMIARDQEEALLTYVSEGHGFIPLHAASFCFRNSIRFVKLVGAQFKSHGGEVFTTTITEPNHPIMQGFQGFETWDETYVHHMHTDDRTILQKRKEEPWTWVKTHGQGRVFYTAYGHDERCWSNPGFHDLLERGILWAVGDAVRAERDKLELKPLKYEDAVLPNYERRDPPPRAQEPLSPERSMKYAQVPVDMKLELFAAEPDIVEPVSMAWDERGRLFVLESIDYPNNLHAHDLGHDKIKILEDTDGDGRADKTTVFADKLSIPTSITFANDGVIVIAGPDIFHLKDTDGDDRADVRTLLFTGNKTHDTHAGMSNLRYGLDNWIWGTDGYSGFQGMVGGKERRFAMGVYRFKPDGSDIEFLQNTTNNTWGLGFTEEGDVVGSTANGNPSFYVTFAKRYYDSVRGLEQPRTPRADVTRDFFPLTTDVRQVDVFGGFTAAAGHAVYTARALPERYWNRSAFITEPTGHLIYNGLLERDGTAFKTTNGGNLYASGDAWSAPVCAEVGPDGAVWFCDWYNVIVQHNPTPTRQRGGYDAETGKGGAYVTPLRDKAHGRIYRIAAKKEKPAAKMKLSKSDPAGLLAALKSDNQFWRLHAQRLLVERGQRDVVGALVEMAKDKAVDSFGLNVGAIHAMWTLQGLGATEIKEVATSNLKHGSAGVRRNAIQIVGRMAADDLLSALATEKDARNLQEGLLALSDAPTSAALGQAVHRLYASNELIRKDENLRAAATVAAAKHAESFLTAALEASPAADPAEEKPKGKEPTPNLVANPSFEEVEGELPKHWKPRTYGGQATHRIAQGGRLGERSVRIESERGSDSSVYLDVPVKPNTEYILTAWIKTENLQTRRGGQGALLNIHALPGQPRTQAVKGTQDWTPVHVKFKTGSATEVGINCLYGGWGAATGVAYWDDIALREIGSTGDTKDIEPQVAYHFAKTATPEVLAAFAAKVKGAKKKIGRSLLVGLGEMDDDSAVALDKGRVIDLRTIPQKLLFDKKELRAKAGERITVRFFNNCDLPHNFALGKPGSLETLSAASLKLAAQPDALEKHYVPDSPEILAHSKLLYHNDREDVTIELPKQPGNYPYLCTFPGHVALMNGVLVVE